MHGYGALFGAILGFVAAHTPEFIQMLKDRFSAKRQLEAKQQELDAVAKGYEYTITQKDDALAGQSAEIDALRAQLAESESENDISGHVALQFLRSSVRPLVTYGFFMLFAIVKIFALHHAMVVEHTPALQLLPVVWDEDTESLFAAVITFWFGSRSSNSVMSSRKKSDDDGKRPSLIKGTSAVIGE